MKKQKVPKPRNPFVQHLINKRGSGAHNKSKKAQRRDDKIILRKYTDCSPKLCKVFVSSLKTGITSLLQTAN